MSDRLYFNGVDGTTGRYLKSPDSFEEVARTLGRSPSDADETIQKLRALHEESAQNADAAPTDDVNVKDLAQTGWGVIFAEGADPSVREALAPLLEHRREQAAVHADFMYREFAGESGYASGDSGPSFLNRHAEGSGGLVVPGELPYYLLIVGGPEQIPFRFQYELGVDYAVGRVHFDRVEDYARYAAAVVEAEKSPPRPTRRAVFFGPRNQDDLATCKSAELLVEPLADGMARAYPDLLVEKVTGEAATKAYLGRLFAGEEECPELLFTASHGLLFGNDDERKRGHQGALLCQDWPGPEEWDEAIPPDFYFSADDIGAGGRARGLIAFHFACYSAGTPDTNDFPSPWAEPEEVSPTPFLSSLPLKLLREGALAVIGHVDRAWGSSFMNEAMTRSNLVTFEQTLGRLFRGFPLGYSKDPFNLRHASLSTFIGNEFTALKANRPVNMGLLGNVMLASNDARNYIIVGDPAVRLKRG